MKQLWNCSGSSRENTSPKVSWDGMPPGSSKKVWNYSSLLQPNISICTHESAPQMIAQMAMVMMSSSLCRLERSILGSSKVAKQSIMDVPFDFAMNHLPSLHADGTILYISKNLIKTRLPWAPLSPAGTLLSSNVEWTQTDRPRVLELSVSIESAK